MRRIAVLALLLLPATAQAGTHTLTGTDSRGHPARLVVDAHLHPVSARLHFGTMCPSPDRYTLDLTRLSLWLVDERMEDGVLHKHWSGNHLHPHEGTVFGPMAVHVSRHADGSIHAQGGASFEHGALITGTSRHRLCLFNVRFVVQEAHG